MYNKSEVGRKQLRSEKSLTRGYLKKSKKLTGSLARSGGIK
jgi:hypothetical protein